MSCRSVFGILVLAAACGTGGGDDGGEGASVGLRSGSSMFFEGPKVLQHGLDPLMISQVGASLVDVSRDGDRIVATVKVGWGGTTTWHSDPSCSDCPMSVGSAGGATETHFLVSEDLGRTWTEHPLERTPGQGTYVRGVHLYGGKAALVTNLSEKHPMGTSDTYPVRLVDLATDTYISSPDIEAHPFIVPLIADGPHVTGASVLSDGHTNRMTLVRPTYSLADGSYTLDSVPATTVDTFPSTGLLSADGLVYEGFGYHRQPNGFCHVTLDTAGVNPYTALCVDGYRLPPSFDRLQLGMTKCTAGVVGILGDDENSYAIRIVPAADGDPDGTSLQITGLGAGRFSDPPRLHAPFGDLIRLRSGESERLVDLKPDGTDLVRLPATPCNDGAGCGTRASHEWSLPLGGDEYLDFYTVETLNWPDTHAFFYMTRDKAVREPFSASTEVGDYTGTGLSGYPNAVEASRVEKVCMAAAGCGITTFDECIIYWRTGPYANPALRLFLMASLDDCSKFSDFWPGRALVGTGGCENVCRNGVLISGCSNGMISRTVECQYYGATCVHNGWAPLCSDFSESLEPNVCSEKGSAVYQFDGYLVATNCTALGGQTCYPGISTGLVVCGFPPETVAACEGDVAVYPGMYGNPAQKEDCTLAGRHCVLKDGRAGCEAPPSSPECANSSTFIAQCQGPYMIFCAATNEMHYIDCRELGGDCVDFGANELFTGTPTCM